MLEFLLRLVIGLFVVYILMFMASLGLILISPGHRKVVSEAAEEQKRSCRFLTIFAATFASAILGIPNGFLVGLIPYHFFSTIALSIFCAFLVAMVTACLIRL